MAAFLIYIIKSSFCLLIFYLAYKILFSYETFFRFNRKVLLAGTVVCLLIPFIPVKVKQPGFIQQPFLNLERTIITETVDFAESSEWVPADSPAVDGEVLLQNMFIRIIYFSGFSFTFIFLLQSVFSLYLLIKKGRKMGIENYTIVILDRYLSPFNWWKYIVISERDFHENQREIVAHEMAHLRKRHSFDLLFIEFVILLQWFNPGAWLLKRELQEIHEYEADSEVLKNGIDATKYQLLLVKKAVGSSSYTFANSFNQSKLKKRITMMCKVKSSKRNRWKLLLMIPVAASVMYAFARPDVNRQLENLLPDEDTTIQGENESYDQQFFQEKLDSYLESAGVDQSLPYEKKIERLDKNSHMSYLLMNMVNRLLLNGNKVEFADIQVELKNLLETSPKEGKPFVILFMHDRGTSFNKVSELLQIVGEFASKHTESPVLVRFGEPRNYGVRIRERVESDEATIEPLDPDVLLGFYINGKLEESVALRHSDTIDEIREKLAHVDLAKITKVDIKAKKDTYMGFITNVKEVLREEKALQVSYSVK